MLGVGVSLRHMRGATSALAFYAANGLRPKFVLDPSRQKYFVDGLSTNLAGAVTHSRASGATYLDSNGVLQTAASGEIRDQAYAYVDGVLTGPYVLTEPESTNLIPDSGTIEQKDVHVTPQEYTLSFLSGSAFRSEINQTLADTAVDVFVYDTSKDSDGGAWRTGALAQASSWYNETLNTATRGSRREFPQVAVIVVEDTFVTVYDGDDPTLPMWATLTNAFPAYSATENSSVYAVNGVVCIGGNAGYGGLAIVNFPAAKNTWHGYGQGGYAIGVYVQENWTTTTDRPDLESATRIGGEVLVNSFVNDVAMTVLPDAPIDPATGLPVPTIAVATDGNGTYSTSVITDDGTVYDIASDSTGTAVSVAFDGVSLSVIRSDGAVYVWDDAGAITTDGISPDATYSASSTPALLGTVSKVAA